MVNRINLLLQAKNITARQFAEEIGIQPSGMSHILSGRNNPSLDFVMKVVRRYPEIDINWLMFGKGEMYESGKGVSSSSTASVPSAVPSAPVSSTVASAPVSNRENVLGQQSMFSDPERTLFSEQPSAPQVQSVENDVKQYGNSPNFKEANLVREQNPYKSPPVKAQSVVERNQNPEQMRQMEAPLQHNVDPIANTDPLVDRVSESSAHNVVSLPIGVPAPKGKRIVRLLAFYDDHTFGEYFPE